MRYVEGIDRRQATLFPELLDDYVKDDNPVRFIDAYVESLDPGRLNFTYSETKQTGRKPYNPADMLKLYIYGYLNRIRSSRRLEQESHRNFELMWLLCRLQPDFKTIADFRKDNSESIRAVCREFVLLCRKLELFGCDLIAIDGSKFKACNSNKRNFTKNKLAKLIKAIDEKIDSYLSGLDSDDQAETEIKKHSPLELQEIIEKLRKKKDKYEKLEDQLKESGEDQLSLTDPDSRMMKTQQGKDVCFNVQIAVDSKHKLIVAHDVTNDCNDLNQLHSMASQADEILEKEKREKNLDVLADAGYFERTNIKDCCDDDMNIYVPYVNHSNNKSLGLYTKEDFRYDPESDTYQCPAGQRLTFRGHRKKKAEIKEKVYTTDACYSCPVKDKCTQSKKTRIIYRWEHEHLIEEMKQRMKEKPEMMTLRKAFVEHPFGTIKCGMDCWQFLTRGLPNVSTEISLSVLVYNIKRVLNIVNWNDLMQAIR